MRQHTTLSHKWCLIRGDLYLRRGDPLKIAEPVIVDKTITPIQEQRESVM